MLLNGENEFVTYIKVIVIKFANIGQKDYGFLLNSKFCTHGVCCPCPQAV